MDSECSFTPSHSLTHHDVELEGAGPLGLHGLGHAGVVVHAHPLAARRGRQVRVLRHLDNTTYMLRHTTEDIIL